MQFYVSPILNLYSNVSNTLNLPVDLLLAPEQVGAEAAPPVGLVGRNHLDVKDHVRPGLNSQLDKIILFNRVFLCRLCVIVASIHYILLKALFLYVREGVFSSKSFPTPIEVFSRVV